jgi:hypothetical protein
MGCKCVLHLCYTRSNSARLLLDRARPSCLPMANQRTIPHTSPCDHVPADYLLDGVELYKIGP